MFFEVGTNMRLRPVFFTVNSGQQKTMQFDVECRAGQALAGEAAVSDVAIEARKLGDVAWVDIETTEIDLTPYDATRQTFELRATAGTITTHIRQLFRLLIVRN